MTPQPSGWPPDSRPFWRQCCVKLLGASSHQSEQPRHSAVAAVVLALSAQLCRKLTPAAPDAGNAPPPPLFPPTSSSTRHHDRPTLHVPRPPTVTHTSAARVTTVNHVSFIRQSCPAPLRHSRLEPAAPHSANPLMK